MNAFSKQSGVTLIEVLVGFVIFTSSLVAILNYVSGQVYHRQLSSENLQKVQLIYSLSTTADIQTQQGTPVLDIESKFDLSASTTSLDSIKRGKNEITLNQHQFTVSNSINALTWSVISLN
ncbi:MAG: hypothetical protein GY806_07865 [Gammaproteobacteria bacterium]|nr:hypothetical protein [Gammaproteobacteria bacterium]